MSATATNEYATMNAKRQFCTFWVAERLYGVDILDVKEINSECEFTPVFHAPTEVNGYVNIRGQIHLIIDLRLLLGFESNESPGASCIVLFKSEVGESFGVSVDRVGDVVEVEEESIESRSKEGPGQSKEAERQASGGDLGAGVCKLDDQLLVILDAARFLDAIA